MSDRQRKQQFAESMSTRFPWLSYYACEQVWDESLDHVDPMMMAVDTSTTVLQIFIEQQLPHLFQSYLEKHAKKHKEELIKEVKDQVAAEILATAQSVPWAVEQTIEKEGEKVG